MLLLGQHDHGYVYDTELTVILVDLFFSLPQNTQLLNATK